MFKCLNILLVIEFIHIVYGLRAEIAVNLYQTGFHRTIKYSTIFTDPTLISCDFSIEQIIPASVYASTDQLDSLQRFKRINYYTNTTVDIEAITENSEPFSIYLYGNIKSNLVIVIELPIHFRYHLPGEKSFTRVSIEKPKLFINCLHMNESAWNSEQSVQFKCPNGLRICDWIPMDYEILTDDVTVSIPIGYKDFRGIVTSVTILVSWVASYYILSAIVGKANLLKEKL